MSVVAAVANRGYAAFALAARTRFERAAADPARAQGEILRRILRENAGSAYGAAHGFGSIRSVSEFRARVPRCDYDALRPAIERMVAGNADLLTAHALRCFEPTGGSSGASKLIPYTDALLSEISAATMPWVFDLLHHRPRLRNGSAYWAVSPPARRERATPGGTRIGMEHDSDYFPRFVRALLDRAIGTPRALAKIPDVATCRYVTLRALLARTDLAFLSVWNPSFLTLLAATLDECFPALLHDLECGELSVPLEPGLRDELRRALPARPRVARELARRFGKTPPDDLGAIWDRLDLISCWADGHAARALGAMRQRFPQVRVQPKGLLSTEGVVSFPLAMAGGAVAAVCSHFLELVPQDATDDAIGVAKAETGRSYEVLLTTSGGLYRYATKDLVRVDGWYHRTPVLTFVGRTDAASDLAGEKLTPRFVEQVIASALSECRVRVPFAMLAPVWRGDDTPHYALFVECDALDAERLAAVVEARLCEAHPYALCRELGQLSPVRGAAVEDGDATYERGCLERGQRAGSIKPVALDARLGWEADFDRRMTASRVT
jgi:hypothetical protein